MKNFSEQWKALEDKKGGDEPALPQITKDTHESSLPFSVAYYTDDTSMKTLILYFPALDCFLDVSCLRGRLIGSSLV